MNGSGSKSLLFPDDLRQVSAGRRIVQRFGWVPWIAGLTLVTWGAALLLGNSAATILEWEVGGIPAAVGVLLFAYEVRRRKQRLSLVAFGDQIGIYRGRNLTAVANRSDVICRGGEFTLRKLWDNFSAMKLAIYSIALGAVAGMGIWIFFSISVLGRLAPGAVYTARERALAGLMLVPCAGYII